MAYCAFLLLRPCRKPQEPKNLNQGHSINIHEILKQKQLGLAQSVDTTGCLIPSLQAPSFSFLCLYKKECKTKASQSLSNFLTQRLSKFSNPKNPSMFDFGRTIVYLVLVGTAILSNEVPLSEGRSLKGFSTFYTRNMRPLSQGQQILKGCFS